MVTSYKLSDYKLLRSPFCFLDETGSLNNERDRFFALGMIKASNPCYIQRDLLNLRHSKKFYEEIKWTKISKRRLPIYQKAISLFLANTGMYFSCIVLRKDDMDFQTHFGGNLWKAYESFCITLLKGNISRNEILSVLADECPVPANVEFERNVRRRINNDFGRLAVQGVCRLDSKGVPLLQIADLLVGAIVYEFKLDAGLLKSPNPMKVALLEKLRKDLGAKTFLEGFRARGFNVHLFKTK